MNARPLYSAAIAVARANEAWRAACATYELGTGNIDTPIDGDFDCCGFATCYCYGIRRHRPGFNVGPGRTVEDDINCNSSIEDARHERDLFEVILEPELGALLKYPTIRIVGADGTVHTFCGHEGIVVGVSRAAGVWNPAKPNYALLDVVQCCGPNGHHPGIVHTDGSIWSHHDALWPKLEHRVWMLRVRP